MSASLVDRLLAALEPGERLRAAELLAQCSAFARRVSVVLHEPRVRPSQEVAVTAAERMAGFREAEAALRDLDAITTRALGMSAAEFLCRSIDEVIA